MNKFVLTCGDINGIGPEIAIKTLNKVSSKNSSQKFYFICPANIFNRTIEHVNPNFEFEITSQLKNESPNLITVLDIGNFRQSAGKPTIQSGKAAYKSLVKAFALLKSESVHAVITAPVSKTALHKAGILFPGQTEMFAEWTNTSKYLMTFLSKKFNAALLTIHKPIKEVPVLLNLQKLIAAFNVIYRMLIDDLGISNPRIAVLGLNPHAGEGGIIGNEERNIITPAIQNFSKVHSVDGPFSSDAFFANRLYKDYNMVLGMYHDQVLIPFKLLNFRGGVNYTAGLPIVRTSPDHGVAYDIAGKYIADESSMIKAYRYAARIAKKRMTNFIEK